MRILSQDGIKFDIAYENCHLVVNGKAFEIEAETGDLNFTPVMASYSSIEKCRKAMEMLHDKYKKINVYLFNSKQDMIPPKVFKFPSEYEVDKVLGESEE